MNYLWRQIYNFVLAKSGSENRLLIVGIIPYFLERESFWFEENFAKIMEVRKTQSFWQDQTSLLEKGQKINFSEFLRTTDEMGYEKVLEVSEPGEFANRGGIIDIFPINLNYAVRIEFWGNLVENISRLGVEVQDDKGIKEILKKRLKRQKLFSDLAGLKPGDYLVHLDHGVAKFLRVEKIQIQTNLKTPLLKIQSRDYYVLEYALGDKLYVPLGLERKLSRYIGFVEPAVSRLSSPLWQKTKKRIREAAEKLAKELLDIYAKREIALRPPYILDTEIDKEVASSFEYELTSDQVQAWQDIKKDMENRENPMDRILCGDVGFGKTEVALRAAVKAVNSGYQASVICPTTILAAQHFQNFKKRLKNLPIKIEILTRLQSKKEQRESVQKIKQGQADIVIGTHRVLSNDIEFKNLGLLIIDDEQRFGVKQKEKLRQARSSLDILSLSATPIPRTLYLALSSLKPISLMQIPPVGRLSVKTVIRPWSEAIIKKAIESEIARGGQVYYLHNRVETIETIKKFLETMVPKKSAGWRIGIAHGRMREKELVKVMDDFQSRKINILIATTIIENGLDLPNVNTLIADDGSKLGLAQAYQIRGRVGRSHIQAFAYFLYGKKLTDIEGSPGPGFRLRDCPERYGNSRSWKHFGQGAVGKYKPSGFKPLLPDAFRGD